VGGVQPNLARQQLKRQVRFGACGLPDSGGRIANYSPKSLDLSEEKCYDPDRFNRRMKGQMAMYEIWLDMNKAVEKLRELEGVNLRPLAEAYGVFQQQPAEKQVVERSRDETIEELRRLRGVNLRDLAKEYSVYYANAEGGFSSSWIVNTLETYLGLAKDSLFDVSFYDVDGPWILEWVPMIPSGDGWRMKEDFSITDIEENTPLPEFRESRLHNWLTRQVAVGVGRFGDVREPLPRREVVRVVPFSEQDPRIRLLVEEIGADFELARAVTRRPDGYSMLTGYMCRWIDPPLTHDHIFRFMTWWFNDIYTDEAFG